MTHAPPSPQMSRVPEPQAPCPVEHHRHPRSAASPDCQDTGCLAWWASRLPASILGIQCPGSCCPASWASPPPACRLEVPCPGYRQPRALPRPDFPAVVIRCRSWAVANRCRSWAVVTRCRSWAVVTRCRSWAAAIRCRSWVAAIRCRSWAAAIRCRSWVAAIRCRSWVAAIRCRSWAVTHYPLDIRRGDCRFPSVRRAGLTRNSVHLLRTYRRGLPVECVTLCLPLPRTTGGRFRERHYLLYRPRGQCCRVLMGSAPSEAGWVPKGASARTVCRRRQAYRSCRRNRGDSRRSPQDRKPRSPETWPTSR